MRIAKALAACLAACLAAGLPGSIRTFAGEPAQEWPSAGRDPGGSRFSPLKQIHRGNVSRLRRAWSYSTGEMALGLARPGGGNTPAFEATPLVIDGVMYIVTQSSRVIALDAESGRELWKYDPQQGSARRVFRPHRGVAYWESGRGSDAARRIVYGTGEAMLVSLDARTGRPDPQFGENGTVNLRAAAAEQWPKAAYSVTSPPAIFRGLAIVGSAVPESPGRGPSGMVRAFDIRTGRLAWRFNTVPQPGEPGHETWEAGAARDRTGANMWSTPSVDIERGLVFLPLGSPSYDFYGGDRKGRNLYGNSLVALDAATGRIRWHFQAVRHDIWDYDLPAQPLLAEIRRNGRAIPAVVQVTKMGFVYVLDRMTGEPLLPVEERPVPASAVPGESAWPVQLFPVKPPPLARVRALTADDITDVTPESRRYCTELFGTLKSGGVFTPLGLDPTLVFPGTLGGATWSGASFDPTSNYLFVNVNEVGQFGALKRESANSPLEWKRTSQFGEYARFWDPDRLPCQKPPWGTLNAVNLSTGEIAWRVPFGFVETLAEKGITTTGTPSLGGSIVTAGGLVFIGGTNDRRFRAFDARTGRELWQTTLEAGGHATPATYAGRRSGRQFVAIAAGGAGYFSRVVSDVIAAYAIP